MSDEKIVLTDATDPDTVRSVNEVADEGRQKDEAADAKMRAEAEEVQRKVGKAWNRNLSRLLDEIGQIKVDGEYRPLVMHSLLQCMVGEAAKIGAMLEVGIPGFVHAAASLYQLALASMMQEQARQAQQAAVAKAAIDARLPPTLVKG